MPTLKHERPDSRNAMKDFLFETSDLAPGDCKSIVFDSKGLDIRRITSSEDPSFEEAYQALWQEFGMKGELESREVLARRLAWDSALSPDETAMRYELVLLRYKDSFVAVRDHTVVADPTGVTVHMSHVLIDPMWRRTGLGGWMRAFPLQTVRRCVATAGLPEDLPVTLVAEMEYPDGVDEERMTRLTAYERAGFKKVDTAVIDYHQPDFRPPEIIDSTGGPMPLRFQLVIRRVNREEESEIAAGEVRSIVEHLYRLYGREFRARDMAAVLRQLTVYPSPNTLIRLLPPTE